MTRTPQNKANRLSILNSQRKVLTAMTRQKPKFEVLRALFARSGNQCAFPGCTAPLFNERNQLITQVCHIEAAEPGGERYNPNQSDDERRGYENLVILCYPHHVETDDVSRFSVKALQEMKANHEQQFELSPFKIDESLLRKISDEMDQYWDNVQEKHKEHIVPELAIPINAKANFGELVETARSFVGNIYQYQDSLSKSEECLVSEIKGFLLALKISPEVLEMHPEHLRKFESRNWEVLNLGLTNTAVNLQVLMEQMELKYLEIFLQINPHDKIARLRLDSLKVNFQKLATSAGYAD